MRGEKEKKREVGFVDEMDVVWMLERVVCVCVCCVYVCGLVCGCGVDEWMGEWEVCMVLILINCL